VKEHLGAATYHIERSAAPARYQASGSLPTPERLAFLVQVLNTLDKARVLIMHGATRSWPWIGLNDELARAFLQVGVNTGLDWKEERVGRSYLSWVRVTGRTAIMARALNGPVSSAYLQRIRRIVDLDDIAPGLRPLLVKEAAD